MAAGGVTYVAGSIDSGTDLDASLMKLVNGATTKDLRYYLLKWFEAQKNTVTVSSIGNWMVVPENLAASGAALDYPLLYPPKNLSCKRDVPLGTAFFIAFHPCRCYFYPYDHQP